MSGIEKCQRQKCPNLYKFHCFECNQNYCVNCIKPKKHRCDDVIAKKIFPVEEPIEAGSGTV